MKDVKDIEAQNFDSEPLFNIDITVFPNGVKYGWVLRNAEAVNTMELLGALEYVKGSILNGQRKENIYSILDKRIKVLEQIK